MTVAGRPLFRKLTAAQQTFVRTILLHLVNIYVTKD